MKRPADDLPETENLARVRSLIETLGYEIDEVPERLPFPALLARVPVHIEGAPVTDTIYAELVIADNGDRINLVLPNIDRLLDEQGLPGNDHACRRILEASFGLEWARASLDETDGELRLEAAILVSSLNAPHLGEVIEELSELLLSYWLERIPAPVRRDSASLLN
jgi:hypothetical protein